VNDIKIKYLVISPVRNEVPHIEKTILSMVNQTIRPEEWIIVDDGSKDGTLGIVEKYAGRYDWIKVIRREDRGYAEPGHGVMEAFYAGYDRRKCGDFDFIVKLDGDLAFDGDYFERVFKEFSEDRKLGIAGGICYIRRNGHLEVEKHPEFHVRGTTKIYRRKCWEEIGGLIKHLGWDTIDEIKAQYKGWVTKSFKNLIIFHHKPTGYNTGTFNWAIKCGEGNYYCGYHPLFVLVKGFRRMILKRPYFLDGIGIIWGYFRSHLKKRDRFRDARIIEFLRREQLNRLLFRKSIWK
jgi:glycosyltransferase involved in cell wall biosynthesis